MLSENKPIFSPSNYEDNLRNSEEQNNWNKYSRWQHKIIDKIFLLPRPLMLVNKDYQFRMLRCALNHKAIP